MRVRLQKKPKDGLRLSFTNMTAGVDMSSSYHDAIVIDGLNVSNWDSPQVFRSLLEGGVTAINATIVTWENFRETLDHIAGWTARFSQHESEIVHARDVEHILRAKQDGLVGVILGFQNASPIENDLGRLSLFREMGVRIIQITYHERNLIGSGCYERDDGGLSNFGVDAIREMNRLGILIDLSHVGPKSTIEAIQLSDKPVSCTHANAKSYFDVPRNKTDEALKLLAEKGGVVGATPITTFLRTGQRSTLEDYIDAVEHMIELVGVDHVGVGTDFAQDQPRKFWEYISSQQGTKYPASFIDPSVRYEDGHSPYPKGLETPDDMPGIAPALAHRGYSGTDISKIIGGNWLRLFQEVW